MVRSGRLLLRPTVFLFSVLPLRFVRPVSGSQHPNVFSTHENAGKRVPVPIEEITRLQKVLESDYPVELCDVPTLGDLVQLGADEIVRGVLVERGEVCRVGICLDSIGRAVCITVPLEVLKPVSDSVTGACRQCFTSNALIDGRCAARRFEFASCSLTPWDSDLSSGAIVAPQREPSRSGAAIAM